MLCAPDDPEALADALESLLQDKPRRLALAQLGRETVLAEFTADRMARDFAAVAADLLGVLKTVPVR